MQGCPCLITQGHMQTLRLTLTHHTHLWIQAFCLLGGGWHKPLTLWPLATNHTRIAAIFTWIPIPQPGHTWHTAGKAQVGRGTIRTPDLAPRDAFPQTWGSCWQAELGGPSRCPLRVWVASHSMAQETVLQGPLCRALGIFYALSEPEATSGKVGWQGRHPPRSLSPCTERGAGNFAGGGTLSAARQGQHSARGGSTAWPGTIGSCPLLPAPPASRQRDRIPQTCLVRGAAASRGRWGRKVCAKESCFFFFFFFGVGARLRRPGSAKRRGLGWQSARPSFPLPAPQKFGSPAIS